MIYVANAFSLQMLEAGRAHTVRTEPVTADAVTAALAGGFTSAIGHADTARVVSGLLDVDVACNRVNVRLTGDDILYVAQVTGGRLPEGATTLPEGMTLQFMRITLRDAAIAEAVKISDTSWAPQYVDPDMGYVLADLDKVRRLLTAD